MSYANEVAPAGTPAIIKVGDTVVNIKYSAEDIAAAKAKAEEKLAALNAAEPKDAKAIEEMCIRDRQWAQPLDLGGHQTSFHVLESGDVADALLRYAEGNQVNMVIMGAATHGLQMQRVLATVPIKVAMQAPCTVILVKQGLPFERLAEVTA